MRISIVGSGYVGLVSGVCLAMKGHKVICVDQKKDIVDGINAMKSPIYEPGLDAYLKQVIDSKRFIATTDLEYAVMHSEVSIVAVGTPFDGKKIDLSFIVRATRDIGSVLKKKDAYHVVCVKSTVVPSTTDTVVKNALEDASCKKAGEIGLAMNPEFLREGQAVSDFMNPDRIVIGTYDDRSYDTVKGIYEGHFSAPIIRVNLRTAEMIKYTANAFLATLISYSNEIAAICEAAGDIQVSDVMSGVALDKRLNPKIDNAHLNPEIIQYLKAGRGFGGSCFPKDVKALAAFGRDSGCVPEMLDATISINERQVTRIIQRIEAILGGLRGKRVVVLGLAFKPETDDIRESQAVKLVIELQKYDCIVICVDPVATRNAQSCLPASDKTIYTEDIETGLMDADIAVLMTPWEVFLNTPACIYKDRMKQPVIFDACGCLPKTNMTEEGINYNCIGFKAN